MQHRITPLYVRSSCASTHQEIRASCSCGADRRSGKSEYESAPSNLRCTGDAEAAVNVRFCHRMLGPESQNPERCRHTRPWVRTAKKTSLMHAVRMSCLLTKTVVSIAGAPLVLHRGTLSREGVGSDRPMRVSETCMVAIFITSVDRESKDKFLRSSKLSSGNKSSVTTHKT